MGIETIRVKNFKVLQNLEMTNIPQLCIIIGANGTGKSTLFDVFQFLKDCLVHNVTRACVARGGFSEVLSRNAEQRKIEIEVQARLDIAGQERVATYNLSICEENRKVVVEREILRYVPKNNGNSFHLLDFSSGKGTVIMNEEDCSKSEEEMHREEQDLDAKDILAIKGLGQFERFKAANALRKLIENWHVSDFHIPAARGSKDEMGDKAHLSDTGNNLQLVAHNIFENYPDTFTQIINAMKHRVPGIVDVQPMRTADGRLLLRFQDGSFTLPFLDGYVSDGTIKMFAYLVLLYDPAPYPVLCVEEPENHLYVDLMPELAEEFRSYARRGGQVFVSTHSPAFLNAAELEEVFWLQKRNGYSQVLRAKDDLQLAAFMVEGDQMGYLWKQGLFEGIDP